MAKEYNIFGLDKYARRPKTYGCIGKLDSCKDLARKVMDLNHPVYIREDRKVVLVFDALGSRTWKEQFE